MVETLFVKNARTKMENSLQYTIGIKEIDKMIGAKMPINSMNVISGECHSGKTRTMLRSYVTHALSNDAMFITYNKYASIMLMIDVMVEQNYTLNMKDVKNLIDSIHEIGDLGDIDQSLGYRPQHMVYIDEPMLLLSAKVEQHNTMFSQTREVYRYMTKLARKHNKIIITSAQSNKHAYNDCTMWVPFSGLENADICIHCIEKDKWVIVKNKWGQQ